MDKYAREFRSRILGRVERACITTALIKEEEDEEEEEKRTQDLHLDYLVFHVICIKKTDRC